MLSTRVRVDMYSNIRAIVETADGKLHMASNFVKASGGCSAAASKDADEALANLGKMQVRTFDDPALKSAIRTPVATRHSFAPPRPAAASHCPSGLNATLLTPFQPRRTLSFERLWRDEASSTALAGFVDAAATRAQPRPSTRRPPR